VGRLEADHNVAFRDAALSQFVGNAQIGAIVLEPDSPVVFDVNMYKTALHPAHTFPAYGVHEVMPVLVVNDLLHFHVFGGGGHLRDVVHQAAHDFFVFR
jgi:hypothetical protein